jgi:outer membrane biosynthesis protein TonB
MKKIIVSVVSLIVAVVGIATSSIHQQAVEDYDDSINQSEIIGVDQDESKEEVTKEDVIETSEIVEENNPQEESKTDSSSEEKKNSQSESQTPISSDKSSSKTQTSAPKTNNSSSANSTSSQTQSNSTTNDNNNSGQKNVVSTTFYDSITGGKKEFRTEAEAFSRGTQIQQNELNAVLDYNEEHPDNQIQPDINYFRVYPSAIDENGNYWYYLHFFCVSGEGQDAYLKSKY